MQCCIKAVFFIVKGQNRDGSTFGPIAKLREWTGVSEYDETESLPSSSDNSLSPDFERRLPPEAILPEEVEDEVPVHDSEERLQVYLHQIICQAQPIFFKI